MKEARKLAPSGMTESDIRESSIRAMRHAEKAGKPFEVGDTYLGADKDTFERAFQAQIEQNKISGRTLLYGHDGVVLGNVGSKTEARGVIDSERNAA